MRDFKNPTYDGPDCVCCNWKLVALRAEIRATARERLEKLLGHLWTFSEEDIDEIVDCVVGE